MFRRSCRRAAEALGRTAFEVLVREHHRSVLAYARSLVKDEGVASDLVQDAFLVAWKKLPSFDASRDFGSWVRGMVRYEYLHWARKRKELPLEEGALDRLDQCFASLEVARQNREDVFAAVRQCVEALPDSLRGILVASYGTGQTGPEIARSQDMGEAAVRKRLQRARENVADCLRHKLSGYETLEGNPGASVG